MKPYYEHAGNSGRFYKGDPRTKVEVLRLCRVLCNAQWCCTEAGVEFAEAWDVGHEQITANVLQRALSPDF